MCVTIEPSDPKKAYSTNSVSETNYGEVIGEVGVLPICLSGFYNRGLYCGHAFMVVLNSFLSICIVLPYFWKNIWSRNLIANTTSTCTHVFLVNMVV